MMNPLTQEVPPRKRGRLEPWPLAIILFFVVVFVVNALFVRFGMRSWTGVVTEGAYVKGLAYNQVLKDQQAQDALGWSVQLDASGLRAGEEGRLGATLRDRSGQPLSDVRIQGLLFRPVQEGTDLSFEMTGTQPGDYSARLMVPLPGQWDVKLRIVGAGGEEYRFAQRIHLQVGGQGG